MQMKQILKRIGLFAVLLVAGAGIASAQTSLKLAFLSADDTVSQIEAKSLSMTIAGDKLIAANGSESLELELNKLVKMYFTTESSGVELATVALDGEVAVYAIDGTFVGNYSSSVQALSNLSTGTYIIKAADNKTIKIAVQ